MALALFTGLRSVRPGVPAALGGAAQDAGAPRRLLRSGRNARRCGRAATAGPASLQRWRTTPHGWAGQAVRGGRLGARAMRLQSLWRAAALTLAPRAPSAALLPPAPRRGAAPRRITQMRGDGKFIVGGNWKCAPQQWICAAGPGFCPARPATAPLRHRWQPRGARARGFGRAACPPARSGAQAAARRCSARCSGALGVSPATVIAPPPR
jgi:hypothetical protein